MNTNKAEFVYVFLCIWSFQRENLSHKCYIPNRAHTFQIRFFNLLKNLFYFFFIQTNNVVHCFDCWTPLTNVARKKGKKTVSRIQVFTLHFISFRLKLVYRHLHSQTMVSLLNLSKQHFSIRHT